MLASSACFHYLKTSLLLCLLMILPIVEPLSFNITDFKDTESTSLIFGGETKIQNGAIMLNSLLNNYNFGVGRAVYGQPLRFKDSSNGHVPDFSTRFSFTIDVSNNTQMADGFAFYVGPASYQFPAYSYGYSLGLYDDNAPRNNIVAVEFDTFANDNLDPTMRHVGINLNSAKSLATTRFDIESNIGKMGHALITYNASSKLLVVSWFFEGTGSGFRVNTSLSHRIDLDEILPEWVSVGFSGSTGESVKEENVIHSWEFSTAMNSTHSEVNKENDIMIKYKFQVKVVVVAVTCSLFSVLVVVGVSWLIIIKKRRSGDGFDLDRETIPRRFDYKELVVATKGFADDRRLGRGGSGQVYKGVLSYLGRVVAVKRIFTNFENSERVFINEVRIISRLIHRNLVQFIGWCHEQGEFLLVFEFMPNGSLDTHLYGEKKALTWVVRYKVALSVATALHYLHEDAEQCVLHRDIKSANVLLDTNFNTKLGDFGMAKLVDSRLKTQRTGVVGTYGYLAPEYINGGRASKESDIYSFGVVALEIACGRRTYQDGEYHVPLVDWVWQLYMEGNILDVVDERLNKEFDVDEMTSLITVGLWCTNPNNKERPKAAQVIKVLQLEAPLPVLSLDMHDRPPPSLIKHVQRPTYYSSQSLPFTNSLASVGR